MSSEADALYQKGVQVQEAGKPAEAERWHRACLELRHQLGDILLDRGDLLEAEGLFRRSLAAQEGLVGHEDLLVQTLFGLGRAAQKAGKLEAAQECLARCLAIEEGRQAVENRVEILLRLSQVARDRGRTEEAEVFLRRCRELGSSRVHDLHLGIFP